MVGRLFEGIRLDVKNMNNCHFSGLCLRDVEVWNKLFFYFCTYTNTLMGLIFTRTNFREVLFSRMSCFTIFRDDLFLRIGYSENFRKY